LGMSPSSSDSEESDNSIAAPFLGPEEGFSVVGTTSSLAGVPVVGGTLFTLVIGASDILISPGVRSVLSSAVDPAGDVAGELLAL
jgi:hypothetical protein